MGGESVQDMAVLLGMIVVAGWAWILVQIDRKKPPVAPTTPPPPSASTDTRLPCVWCGSLPAGMTEDAAWPGETYQSPAPQSLIDLAASQSFYQAIRNDDLARPTRSSGAGSDRS